MTPSTEQTPDSTNSDSFSTPIQQLFAVRDLSNLCDPHESHFSLVAAPLQSLCPAQRNALIEAEIFAEMTETFGSEAAVDLLYGCQVRDGRFDVEVTALVMKHISPEMISVDNGLMGVFGCAEREGAAAKLIEHARQEGAWTPCIVDTYDIARYLNGTPFASGMPSGNRFVHEVESSEPSPVSATVVPNYRLIFRAWKGSTAEYLAQQ
jgi:hypothetical protein